MYQTLLTHVENNTIIVTINRPEKLNAINKTVMAELNLVIDELINNNSLQSAIITGAGPKSFVAGADINQFEGLSIEDGKLLAQTGLDVFFKIENCSKPIIAAVNGFALGAGCELAMACHFIIAAENAKFGQPEVNLGLIPGYGGTQRLVSLIGKNRAIELLITANVIDANTALQYGLVNHVVAPDQLMDKAKSILQVIHSKAPLAVAKCIEAANMAGTEDGYITETNGFGYCFGTSDMVEGTKAFTEKRKAIFTGN